MYSKNPKPRTYSKKPGENSPLAGLLGNDTTSSSKSTYKNKKSMNWHAPAVSEIAATSQSNTKVNATPSTTDKKLRAPNTPKGCVQQGPAGSSPLSSTSSSSKNGKGKDETGATVLEIDPRATHGFELPIAYDSPSASANPIATLKDMLDRVTTTCQTLDDRQCMTLPVDPTKAVFENIRKGLCSAILRLDQTETDRAIDLVKQFEDDEGTAKAHKAALAAKDELWEGFIEQKIRDVKAECEANINIIQTNNTPTTANDTTIRDLEAEHRATIDNMTRSYAQTIQAIKSECNEKIRTVETEKQMAAASEDAFHNLEAKHKAEIEEMQKEREEFQKMLLDNNDRLTEENIRLKTIADAVKADNIWDLHDSEDNDSEDNDSEDNDSEDNDSEDNDSEDNDSEDNDSDQDTNASVDEKENDTFTVDSYANNPANDQENKEPLGPVCVTVSESPSPFRDEPLEEYFDAGEAWNNRQLRYIDGPEVSPTAGRTSSVRKRAREEQDETATAAESPTRQKRHCVVAGTEASTPRRKLRFRGGSRK